MERWNAFSSHERESKHRSGSQILESQALEDDEDDEEKKGDKGHQRAQIPRNIHKPPDVQVVVATCGFGMGIDSPYVRAVVQVGYSRSITEYVQESGRAGRDGKPANCVLLFSNHLMEREKAFIAKTPSEEIETMRLDADSRTSVGLKAHSRRAKELAKLNQWVINEQSCRRQSLFGYMDQVLSGTFLFSDAPPQSIKTGPEQAVALCDYCVQLDRESLTTPSFSRKAYQPPKLGNPGATGQLATISEGEQAKATRGRRIETKIDLTFCTSYGSGLQPPPPPLPPPPQNQEKRLVSQSRKFERFPIFTVPQTPSSTCRTQYRPFQAFHHQGTENPCFTLHSASQTAAPSLNPPIQLSDARQIVNSFSLRYKELANLCKP